MTATTEDLAVHPALACEDVSLSFGGVHALSGVGFSLAAGEVIGLIGPNGAGKSSLINCVTGFYRPSAGRVKLAGVEATNLAPQAVARLGVSRTFQQAESLAGMGAADVMLLGCDRFLPRGLVRYAFGGPRVRRAERDAWTRVVEIGEALGIADYVRDNTAFEGLPYGVRKLVDLGRALATQPTVLLMDEPAAGLSPGEKERMISVIEKIRDERGIAQLLVDHDVDFVSAVSSRLVVLDAGRLIAEGPCAEVLATSAVIDAYIGRMDDAEPTAGSTHVH